VFQVLNRKPQIEIDKPGKKISNLKGEYVLTDVEFTYPAKKDIPVLKKISLTIEAGKKTALVGESGSGKSTIMMLIERFYDID